ncbi:hypothetical protein, partial [Streptomyces sp. 5-10]
MCIKYYYLIVLLAAAVAVNSQVHYIPAQIYIPVNSHNPWNNTGNPHYNNTQVALNNRSWTGPGHIFWGRIGPLDRLLFNEAYFKD